MKRGCRRCLQQLCMNTYSPQLEEHQSYKIHFDLEARGRNLNVLNDGYVAEHEAFELGATVHRKPASVHVQRL